MIKSTHRPHSRLSAGHWQELIDRQSGSGLSQKAFCAQEGIALSTFALWKRRLGEGNGSRASERASAPVGFTELNCPPGQAFGDDERDDEVPGWEVELKLGGGWCLRLRRVAAC